jgi:hypothetical protein
VTAPGPGPGWRDIRWPAPVGTPERRTWLEAATALPDRYWVRPATTPHRPPFARVYRTAGDPSDPELGPCWHWRCSGCGTQSLGCAHTVLHEPGTWAAAFCGGFHHVHTEHPRPRRSGIALPGWDHTVMFGRRRCDWSPPAASHLEHASWVLCGRTGMPRGAPARDFAREVLALAGRRTP